jgi:hypothetical protein
MPSGMLHVQGRANVRIHACVGWWVEFFYPARLPLPSIEHRKERPAVRLLAKPIKAYCVEPKNKFLCWLKSAYSPSSSLEPLPQFASLFPGWN